MRKREPKLVVEREIVTIKDIITYFETGYGRGTLRKAIVLTARKKMNKADVQDVDVGGYQVNELENGFEVTTARVEWEDVSDE